MNFMTSYKHLDNLCHQIYPDAQNGISGYIEDMENNPTGNQQVRGWTEDYKTLKHYRWVRNQIAHEENMSESGDTEWLENFSRRIMDQTDPLALLHQMSKPHVQEKPSRKDESIPYQKVVVNKPIKESHSVGCATMIIGVLLVIVLIMFLIFL